MTTIKGRLSVYLVLTLILANFLATQLPRLNANYNSAHSDQGFYLMTGLWIKDGVIFYDGSRHPLYPILLALLFARPDIAYFTAAKLFSLALGGAALLAVFFLGRRTHGEGVALLAMLLLSLSSHFLIMSSMALSETLLALTFFLTWHYALLGFAGGRRWAWAVAGFCAGLAYLAKGTGQLLAPSFLLSALLLYRRWIVRQKALLLFVLFYLIPASAIHIYNYKVYHDPLFNYSSRHTMWLDGWEGYYVADPHELPTWRTYLRTHTLAEIWQREWEGAVGMLRNLLSALTPDRMHFLFRPLPFPPLLACLLALALLFFLFRHNLAAYCAANRERVVFTGVLLGVFFVLFSWYYRTSSEARFFVPLFPMIFLWVAEPLCFLGRRFAGHFLPSWDSQKRAGAYVALCLGALLLLGGFSAFHFENPFARDWANNADTLEVMSWLGREVPQGTVIVYEPSHALPIWLCTRGLTSIPYLDWGHRRPDAPPLTTPNGTRPAYRPQPGPGYIFAFVPYNLTWLEFSAYLRQNNAAYVIVTDEMLKRRQALLAPFFRTDRNQPISILALPSDWEPALVYKDLPARYLIFRLRQAEPDQTANYARLGDSLRARGKIEEAIVAYKQAVAAGGNWPGLYAALGRAYEDTSHLEEALDQYRWAVRAGPDVAWYHYLQGEACRALGRPEEAIAEYRAALEMADWPALHAAMAEIYQNSEQTEAALAEYEAAIKGNPQDARYRFLLGNFYRTQERYDEAQAEYEAALVLEGEDWPALHLALGQTYEARGRPQEAIAEYQAAGLWPIHVQRVRFGSSFLLLGYDLDESRLAAEGRLRLTLYWRCLKEMKENYTVNLKLVNGLYHVWGQAAGQVPTATWRKDDILKDAWEIAVLPGTPPGQYRLEMIVYDTNRQQPLETDGDPLLGPVSIFRREGLTAEVLDIEHPLEADLGDKVRLLGYNIESGFRSGDGIHLTLFWQAISEMKENYTVFTHLIDERERIWGQKDNEPVDGFYPTSEWEMGEIVRDQYDLIISLEAPPGEYQIEVGMYLVETGERLEILDREGKSMGSRILLERLKIVR